MRVNPGESITLTVAEAEVTLSAKLLTDLWLNKLRHPAAKSSLAIPALDDGEEWAGILIDDGKPLHHVILLPGELDAEQWKRALDWAKGIGGDLPFRREQSLLFANLQARFQAAYYWSNERHASGSGYAWCQHFSGGGQGSNDVGGELRARAVRRLEIQ